MDSYKFMKVCKNIIIDYFNKHKDTTDKELISIDLVLNYDDHDYHSKINFAGRNKVSTGD